MKNKKAIDISEYIYQKLSYYLIFNEHIEKEISSYLGYLKNPLFWQVFQTELSFLLSRHCLLEEEISRIYFAFQVGRELNLDNNSISIINECISKVNIYRSTMNVEYYDGFYLTEFKKRFPEEYKDNQNLQDNIPAIKGSIAMDFPLLIALIQEDEQFVKDRLLPIFHLRDFVISNLRAFDFEFPKLLVTEVFYRNLSLLIEKWEQDSQQLGFVEKVQMRQKIRQYKKYLK